MLYSDVDAGGYEPAKHESLAACAAQELAEEAQLCAPELLPLLPPGHGGVHEVKWCRNRFQPFLAIAPEAIAEPPPRDPEELLEVRVQPRLGVECAHRHRCSSSTSTAAGKAAPGCNGGGVSRAGLHCATCITTLTMCRSRMCVNGARVQVATHCGQAG